MSLLDQNWGAIGNGEDEAQEDQQQGRQVTMIDCLLNVNQRSLYFVDSDGT
jgi:hypothetical protein